MVRSFAALFLLFFSSLLTAGELRLIPDPQSTNDLQLSDLGNGEWEVRTTGADPYLLLKTDGSALDLQATPMLSLEYFSATGVGRTLVFVGPAIDVPHMITVDMGRREGWGEFAVDLRETLEKPQGPVTSMRLTLGQGPGVVARLRNPRARAATEQEVRLAATRTARLEADAAHAERLRAYFSKEFPAEITKVSASAGMITVEGKLGNAGRACQLAEVPMWEDVTALKTPASLHGLDADDAGNFKVSISRAAVEDREPLLSGWAVVRMRDGVPELLSAMRYVEEQTPRANLPAAAPRSKKGIGGCPFDHSDMQELGIASVTLNFILNELLHAEPGPGRTPYVFAGRTWYADDAAVTRYDRDMKIAAENGWMVSAIVLLPPVRNAPENAWIREAAHPEADPGAGFVLPDFTSKTGVNAYAAAMNFVTERYSRPDGEYGRVHHWIMHNEINSGFFWASAGQKTDISYMDLYQKSMRVACLLARQYDANSKPLISLEHCWGRRADVRGYAGRDLMEHLVSFSHREGDFPWAIAHHPYPQDIFNPRTWEDSQASFDFATPYLTYRNIEVLDAWARQERVRYRGRPREIQLTEQGLNSPDYSEKSLRDQAAGMAYAWEKIATLDTVTAFQYHLWADDRGEGGLRLGLRKFGDDQQDPHGIKPIWHLYRALGTEGFAAAAQPYLEVVGVGGWDEVRFRGEVKK
ncbi:MAG: hypothetical protein KDN05_14090 [Verrucomicrobiae bacterium]|nr:hypothetical protein [Verrucomicrobiae bacterium]